MGSWSLRALAALLASAAVFPVPAEASQQLQSANPTWSRDGTQIAFAYVGGTRGRIAVIGSSGGGKRLLFGADSCCEPVRWAAGNRIAFISNFDLVTVGAGGGKPTVRYAGGDAQWFILSPNGETAAIDVGYPTGSVALVPIRGGRPFVVPRPKNASDSIDGFSPDGTELHFTRVFLTRKGSVARRAFMVESVRGGAPTPTPLSLPAIAAWPQWSPDGKWIAFQSRNTLQVASTSGGAPVVLASDLDGASSFSWSPTSTRIAFNTRFPVRRLAVVDLSGTQVPVSGPVTWASNDSWDRPQWSPDGTQLVFMSQGGGIWVVGADGSGLRRLA